MAKIVNYEKCEVDVEFVLVILSVVLTMFQQFCLFCLEFGPH